MMSALITVPAVTSMLSVPDNVPLEGNENVPVTSNEFAFAVPKLNAMAHTAQASALLDFDFMIATPLGGNAASVQASGSRLPDVNDFNFNF
jgi:hypothetical protein